MTNLFVHGLPAAPCPLGPTIAPRCRAEWEAFHVPALADSEASRAEELMRRMHLAFGGAEGGGVRYWMTAGSAVGGLYHHSVSDPLACVVVHRSISLEGLEVESLGT